MKLTQAQKDKIKESIQRKIQERKPLNNARVILNCNFIGNATNKGLTK